MSRAPTRWVAAASAFALLLSACGTNSGLLKTSTPAASPTTPRLVATASPSVSPAPTATPAPRPTTVPTPTPTPLPLTPIAGLFGDPRSVTVDERIELPDLPAPTFVLDAGSRADDTLLFDRASGAVTNLGRGFRGWFSPDGTRMAWIRITSDPTGELRLLDLASADQRRLGPGVDSAPWVDDQTVLSVDEGARNRIVVDVESGQRELAPPYDPPNEPFASQFRGDLKLVRITRSPPFVFELRGIEDGTMLIRFQAETASFAADRVLVVATPAEEDALSPNTLSSNIFLLDIDTLEATFVASTTLTVRPLIALSANERFVAWTDQYCGATQTLRIHDRATGALREYVGAGWALITPDDQLAIGEFGATALFDLETGEYSVALPGGHAEVNWSPDYRYASTGAELGHGGRCPP